MRILHICENDSDGGAARACYRLHQALRQVGVDSQLLVMRKFSNDPTVHQPFALYYKILKPLRRRLEARMVKKYTAWNGELFSPCIIGFSGVSAKIRALSPDVVNLHYVASGTISVEEIARWNKPVVLTLHDMNFFTGGCHYSGTCDKYVDFCGSCPVLGGDGRDLSSIGYARRKIAYERVKNLSVIGLSSWIANEAAKSQLFKARRIVGLRNPINLNQYTPRPRTLVREHLGLPVTKKMVLFGAVNALSDRRKGFVQLHTALKAFDENAFEIIILGANSVDSSVTFRQKVHFAGNVRDELLLVDYLSCADVVAVPSLQENLSNFIVEAIACGAWVVGFDVGGNRDIIEEGLNGYLASVSSDDFSAKLAIALGRTESSARTERFMNEFSAPVVAARYKDYYRSLLA